jgi:hypothetical protein
MKIIFFVIMALVSFSASAAFTEVECTGQANTGIVNVSVDEGFPPGSFRRATVSCTNENRAFFVSSRGSFGNRVRYEGAGLQLEVDFWPDTRPQWGRTYRATFDSSDMNIPFTQMWCRFPNIRP